MNRPAEACESEIVDTLRDLRSSSDIADDAQIEAVVEGARAKLFYPDGLDGTPGSVSPAVSFVEDRPCIGRYKRIELTGFGGMGIVHRCYDPWLQREVAIKIRRNDSDDRKRACDRLWNEARALSALNHENVVRVYDVGGPESEDLHVILEFVRGVTLFDWLAERRSVTEILDVFTQVGRGLAAAHDREILHRDVKPSNIVVGDDGRVKLIDFGIAKVFDQSTRVMQRKEVQTFPELYDITAEGQISGTRGFLAPELLRGERPTIASDIFSYCVTLYWALYRRAPFTNSDSCAQGLKNDLGEYLEPTAGQSAVPWRVKRVLRKGLSRRPEDRHRSMHELLDALTRRPYIRPLQVGAFVALLALSDYASSSSNQDAILQAAEFCNLGDVRWSLDNRDDMRKVFEDTGAEYGSVLANATNEYMEEYTNRWNEQRIALCSPREDLSPPRHEKVACLRRDADRFEGIKELLFRANQRMLVVAPDLLSEVFPLPNCEHKDDVDDCLSAQDVMADEATRDLIYKVDKWIDRSRSNLLAGEFDEAIRQAKRAVASVKESYPKAPTTSKAKAEHALGVALYHGGRYSDASMAFSDASEKGRTARCSSLTKSSEKYLNKIRLLDDVSSKDFVASQDSEPSFSGEGATALSKLSHSDDLLTRVVYLAGFDDDTQSELASKYFSEALLLRERAVGTSHPSMYKPYFLIGIYHAQKGDYNAASDEMVRALNLARRSYAAENFESAQILSSLAQVAMSQGDMEGAHARAEEAVRLTVELRSDEFMSLRSLSAMAEIFSHNEEYEEATRLFERILDRQNVARVGADSRYRASVLVRLAEISYIQKNFSDSLSYAEQARLLLIEQPQPRDTLLARVNLAAAEATLDFKKVNERPGPGKDLILEDFARIHRMLIQAIDIWERREDFEEHLARARWALARVLCGGYGSYLDGRREAERALGYLQDKSSTLAREIVLQRSDICNSTR